ncbi:MAG: TRAP transporter small permease [Selenomonadaceae bacterium]
MGEKGKVLENIMAFLASTAMIGIVVMVFANVIMRYVFNTGLTWSDEISVNLFVWFIFLGAVLAAIDGLHLKVDVFTSQLNKKNQKIFAMIANVFVLVSMGILFVGGINLVRVTNNNISSVTGMPFSYITVSLVFFAVCIILLTIYDMIKVCTTDGANKEVSKK